jgi:hypothetical protein
MNFIYNLFILTKDSGLLIHEILHSLFVFPFLLILWSKTKDIKIVLICFLTTYFWDLDHLFDYWSYHGFGFNLLDFFGLKYFRGLGNAFVPLHSWELITILGLISYKKGWNSIVTAIFFGSISHMVWDAITIKSFIFYFLIYRTLGGFKIFIN